MVLTTAMTAAPRLREARRELGRLWWIPLLSGIAWLILAWVLLSFDVTTSWTVAVFAAIFMFYGGVIEMTIAAVTPSWRWLHVLLAVAFIAAAEFFHHHPLLFGHALEVENAKREQARKARNVVRQNHRLRNDQQPER